MPNTLKLEIVTPEARTYSDSVEMVTLPGIEGEMGVYPQHVPLMTQLVPGEITIRKDGQDLYLAVGDGFVEITAERVSILTDMAVRSEQIDEAKAEEARKRAEARLAEKIDDEEAAVVTAALANSLAQIHVKRRHPRQ
ncbi:MAG TPA: F0F1 ATP synthase subunit epsilon [Candidatus Saccharimonadales bacterium]|nr:F0F1 ATP synthase subunit epsilon [Candidatus Saccharimonadales bacterium]